MPSETSAPAERLVSLDAFRGFTIASMILVNNPGSWSYVYPPLAHAEWHGWTFTDLIFPFFLFIVGVAMTISFGRRLGRGDPKGQIFLQVMRRSAVLFALGLILNGFPYYDFSTIRIAGVLQRIAVCYFFTSLIVLRTTWRGQAATSVVLMMVYWLLMKLVPVPGYGAGVLGKDGNLAAYVDNLLLHGHTWKPTWDPEGIISTLPAISTTLFGVLTGHWLRSEKTPLEKTAGLFVFGNIGLLLGVIMDIWLPVNKNLWTSSYSVFMGGMALQFLAMFYWLVDVRGHKKWVKPFVIYGMNAIAVFFLSSFFARILTLIRVSVADGKDVALKTSLYQNVFLPLAGPLNGSLLFAISYVLLWLGLMTILYRRRIFIKI